MCADLAAPENYFLRRYFDFCMNLKERSAHVAAEFQKRFVRMETRWRGRQPPQIRFGKEAEQILATLPRAGSLLPYLQTGVPEIAPPSSSSAVSASAFRAWRCTATATPGRKGRKWRVIPNGVRTWRWGTIATRSTGRMRRKPRSRRCDCAST